MHEEWTKTRDNKRAITVGQGETGGIITAAAIIMIAVFSGFILGDNRIIKLFGIGLGGAIFIDAFILRTVLVPSLMHLFGKANWCVPEGPREGHAADLAGVGRPGAPRGGPRPGRLIFHGPQRTPPGPYGPGGVLLPPYQMPRSPVRAKWHYPWRVPRRGGTFAAMPQRGCGLSQRGRRRTAPGRRAAATRNSLRRRRPAHPRPFVREMGERHAGQLHESLTNPGDGDVTDDDGRAGVFGAHALRLAIPVGPKDEDQVRPQI